MNIASLLLAALLVAGIVLALRAVKKGKTGGCSGCNGDCSRCDRRKKS